VADVCYKDVCGGFLWLMSVEDACEACLWVMSVKMMSVGDVF
jgi:hypothetical protein